MSSTKCQACGVINFANSETCRRCGAELPPIDMVPRPRSSVASAQASSALIDEGRGFGRWVLWIFGVTATILISCYVSLLASSDSISAEEQNAVTSAIDVLERAGFSRESFALRHVVSYRSTDNWWNDYVGHQTAYAATNFHFAGTATRACGRTHASGPPAACRCSSAAGKMGSRTVWSNSNS